MSENDPISSLPQLPATEQDKGVEVCRWKVWNSDLVFLLQKNIFGIQSNSMQSLSAFNIDVQTGPESNRIRGFKWDHNRKKLLHDNRARVTPVESGLN